MVSTKRNGVRPHLNVKQYVHPHLNIKQYVHPHLNQHLKFKTIGYSFLILINSMYIHTC
jgi:hypothetical protein